MDRAYEKASEWLGSTLAVGLFAIWLIYHTAAQRDYISFISELAILIGLLILRAENVQAKRMEQDVKKDVRLSKRVLKEIKELRYLK